MLPVDRPAGALALALLLLLGLLASIALRRFRRTLLDERTSRIEAEQTLARTGAFEALARALSRAQTPAEVAYACLSELLPAAGVAAGALAVVSDDGQLVVLQAMGYADAESAGRYTVSLASKTVLTEVVRRQKPLALTSREHRSAALQDLALDPVLDRGRRGDRHAAARVRPHDRRDRARPAARARRRIGTSTSC